MEYIKKTILLTNKSKQLCILNIRKTHNGYFANFKNFSHFPDSCILGISVGDNKVIKQNVVCNRSGGYDFKLERDFDLNQKIGCVLLEDDDKKTPLVWGANGHNAIYRSKVLEYINSLNREGIQRQNVNNRDIKSVPINIRPVENDVPQEESNLNKDKDNIDIDDKRRWHEIWREGDNGIAESDEVNKQDVVVNSKSEESIEITESEEINTLQTDEKPKNEGENIAYTYGVRDTEDIGVLGVEEALFETDEEEVEQTINNALSGENGNFFNMIEEQIDDLFANYPAETNLEAVVPNSKWVKVNYDNSPHAYVVGLIYELEVVKYVAYGVPANGTDEVPESLDGYSQWIPLDPNTPDGAGYFVMFQDADTGESIKI